MAAINSTGMDQSPSSRKRAGVRRIIKHSLKTDMTPMVDLGFLLITFFVITARLSEPVAMNLYMPHDGPPTAVGKSNSIAFLLDNNNQLFYYYDEEEQAVKNNTIYATTYNEKGIGQIIAAKQKMLDENTGGRDNLVVLIKPGNQSSYENVVDVLDEMTIHGVKRYAIVKPGTEDARYMALK